MRPEPLRFKTARAFLASARDMGDAVMIGVAIRVYDATCYPRAKPCSAADLAVYADWKAELMA